MNDGHSGPLKSGQEGLWRVGFCYTAIYLRVFSAVAEDEPGQARSLSGARRLATPLAPIRISTCGLWSGSSCLGVLR